MKLIVGLGNPGQEYIGTRHNVGFFVLEAVSHKLQATSKFKNQSKFQAEVCKLGDVLLAKPQTFMNKSGQAVQKLAAYYSLLTTDIYVIHDDLDIVLGEYKIVLAKGPKVHNGLNSIEQSLGTKDFWRVRVGVDSRTPEERSHWAGRDYVLSRFSSGEQIVLDRVAEGICQKLVGKLG